MKKKIKTNKLGNITPKEVEMFFADSSKLIHSGISS